jgi:GT2 family glycosyltransferase
MRTIPDSAPVVTRPAFSQNADLRHDVSFNTLNIAVGIATSGRREILAQTIALLAEQTRLPDCLVICPVKDSDVDETSLASFPRPTTVVRGPVGLPAQRNKILSAVADADVIAFFDDDFFVGSNYLKCLESIFRDHQSIVGVTGALLADGAQGPGLKAREGLELVRSESGDEPGEVIEQIGLYGCNMAFRMKAILDHGIRFDEKLPLYGWQEDIDFSVRIGLYGRNVKSSGLRGVHLGIKAGRTSGVRFGYSQIMNPVYLARKGSMSWRHAAKLMSRNIAANLGRSFVPEPWIDRKGRLKGNILAMLDIARGRISPDRILELN